MTRASSHTHAGAHAPVHTKREEPRSATNASRLTNKPVYQTGRGHCDGNLPQSASDSHAYAA